jgi:hypothetical protein
LKAALNGATHRVLREARADAMTSSRALRTVHLLSSLIVCLRRTPGLGLATPRLQSCRLGEHLRGRRGVSRDHREVVLGRPLPGEGPHWRVFADEDGTHPVAAGPVGVPTRFVI